MMDTPRLRFKDELGAKFTDWNKRRIKEILTIYNGRDYKDLKYGEYPVLGTGGVITYVDKYLCNWNCACIGRKGTINKPFFMDKPFWCVDTLFYTKPKEKNNPKFQFYLFETIDWQKYNTATGVPSLTGTTIGNINVEIPTIFEQNKIADFLSSYDEKISIQRERVESLERRKKGLLQKVFSQEIRFKAEDGGIYEKWESKTIGDVTVPTAGATPSTKNGSYWIGGDIPWMSSGEVHNGQVFKTEKFITAKGYSNSSTKLLPPNTVVVALAGQGKTRGSVAITRIKLCTNQSLAGLVLKEGSNVISDYLYQYLKNQYSELRKVSSGDGGRGGLNLNIISEFPIILPSLKEQRKIADFFTVIDDQINIEKERLVTMEAIKKGLLQGLFC